MRVRWVLLSLLALSPALVRAQTDPLGSSAQVLSVMTRACDWQLANLPTERISKDDAPLNWIRVPFYLGDLALYRQTQHDRYLQPLLEIASQAQYQPGKRFRHADDQAIDQLYGDLFFLKSDPAMIAPMRQRWDQIIAQPMAGRDDWWWCDALFMAPPALARLGAATGNRAYFDFLDKQFWDTTNFLYDKSEHLYFRDKSYFQTREANGQKIFWSRGNGWVLAGLARVLEYLPADDPKRGQYVQLFKDMSARIISLQQPDGFWRTSLLNPASCPGGESSGTGFFCYGLAWGMNQGLLPRDAQYLTVVHKAWGALSGAVDDSGKLHWVQLPGAKPALIHEADTAEYGVGALLLAGSELLKLTGNPPLMGDSR